MECRGMRPDPFPYQYRLEEGQNDDPRCVVRSLPAHQCWGWRIVRSARGLRGNARCHYRRWGGDRSYIEDVLRDVERRALVCLFLAYSRVFYCTFTMLLV